MEYFAALVALLPALATVAGLRVASHREGPPSTAPITTWPDDHPWGSHCGGAVWGWGGIEGQCALEWNHRGECET
jgi:hypothetical protein